MVGLTRVGQDILRAGGHKNSEVYRGILELLSRFGYISIQEVMYGFQLPIQEAINRLYYLEKSQFIQRFPSLASPDSFYYLTLLGRQAVMTHQICDHISEFYPSRYTPSSQYHHRTITMAYLAIRKLLGTDYLDWKTELQLKKDGGTINGPHRVLDGEFSMTIHKEKYAPDSDGAMQLMEETTETWECGFEFEQCQKSARRYEKQFHLLSRQLYDPNHQYRLPLILFLYDSNVIEEKLALNIAKKSWEFGRCIFLLGDVNQFLNKGGDAPLMKFVGGLRKIVLAKDLNRVKVQIV